MYTQSHCIRDTFGQRPLLINKLLLSILNRMYTLVYLMYKVFALSMVIYS